MKNIFTNTQTPQFRNFINNLPKIFEQDGEVIYKGRNILKRFVCEGQSIIVKSYCTPIWFNKFVYRFFRKPKCVRSYEYADLLIKLGIGSPRPIGYYVENNGLFIGRTYFACLESECPYTYRDFRKQEFANKNEILKAIADTTALLHDNGIVHKDYSAGNILFGEFDGKIKVEIIDLNRIRFEKVDLDKGCRNFDRIPGSEEDLRVMSDQYAKKRNFDPERCFEIIKQTHGADNKYVQ